MLWFVDPTDSSRAVNLDALSNITVKDKRISFNSDWWDFTTEVNATRIFEQMIRVAQEGRYHAKL